jgi:hypothetical protein
MSKALTTTNVVAVVAALALAIGISFSFTGIASADTMMSSCHTFTQSLKVGASGGEVMWVQQFLNGHNAMVNATGAGSPGNETSKFGPATKKAVMKWQAANGVSPASGYWGPLTRAAANAMCAGNPGPNPTPGPTTSGPISVAMAAVQPGGTIIAGGSAANIGNITFTGNGSVKILKLQRTGVSVDNSVDNVYLYDGNVRISDSASVVNGVITFNSGTGLFNVAGSRTVSVRADVASSANSGNSLGFNVWSITPLGGTEMMVTNAVGPLLTISSLGTNNTASINISNTPTPSTMTPPTVSAGTTGYSIWLNTMNVNIRSVNLKSLTFKYTGSASTDALANVKLLIDGVDVGVAPVWSTNSGTSRIGFDLGAAPKLLSTGGHSVELRADIVGGSFRNFTIGIENRGDIVAEDTQIAGFNVGTTYNNGTFGSQTAGTITVSAGTLTVTLDPAFTTQTQIVGGASNVAIASYKFQAYGEDVKVETMSVTPQFGTIPLQGNNGIRNLTVYANGGAIGSAVSSAPTGTATPFTLGSSLIIPAGTSVIVQVRGDLQTSTSTNYTTGTINAAMSLPINSYKGITSSQYNTGATNITSTSLTISSSNVTFGVTSGFTAKTVSPNSQAVKIGSFTINAGSAEGITVNNIAVALTLGVGNATTNLSNLRVTDAQSPIGQPTLNNSFSVNYTIPANGTKTIDVFADLSTLVGATVTTLPQMTVSYRGSTSNVTSSVTTTSTATITSNVGTLTSLAQNSGAPIAQYVVGGNTVVVGPLTAKAATSDIVLTKATFNVTGANGISAVTLGGITQTVVGGAVSINGLSIPVSYTNAAGVNIPLSVTLAAVTVPAANTNTVLGLTLTGYEYTSGSQTTVVTGQASSSMPAHVLVGTKPVVSVTAANNAGLISGNQKIGEITVAADAAGQVGLATTTFTATYSGVTGGTMATAELRDGSTVITTFPCVVSGAAPTFTVTCTANTGFYQIPASTSKVFSLYANVGGTLGAAGASSVTTQLSPATGFLWQDQQGGSAALTGSLILNFPTNTYSTHN